MRTICKNCGTDIETSPGRVGLVTQCSECGARMIPKVPEDAIPPGLSLFRQQLSQPQSQFSFLVRKWFGYEFAWMDNEVCISKNGMEVDLGTVYWRIEADRDKREEFSALERRLSM